MCFFGGGALLGLVRMLIGADVDVIANDNVGECDDNYKTSSWLRVNRHKMHSLRGKILNMFNMHCLSLVNSIVACAIFIS